jgi:multiple sugar transport system ATP-binding protein
MRHPGAWLTRWIRPSRVAGQRSRDTLIAARVAEAARLLGLEDLLDRFPGQLSGGEQQRVALGRAIVRQPGIYLLDEPLSHLDARLRAELRRQLHLLHRQLRATIVYVTHDQVEAMALGQRLVVLDRGVLQQEGPPAQVYGHPRNRFVAGFLGWPPMNLMDGRLGIVGDQVFFAAGNQRVPLVHYNKVNLRPYVGQPVTLGIRPEHVTLAGERGQVTRIAMEVLLTEPLGSETLVTFQRDGLRIVAKLDDSSEVAIASRSERGEVVEVALAMDHMHLFDRASGLALDRQSLSG